jgi:hypothetical protein
MYKAIQIKNNYLLCVPLRVLSAFFVFESRVWTPGRSVAEALERKRQAMDPKSAIEQRGI